MSVAVLTYHSMRIEGRGYPYNDLVALADDLRTISAEGIAIQPLRDVVAAWLRAPHELESQSIVALTCDDGADFDAVDLTHPAWGPQRSVLGILQDFGRDNPGGQPGLHITAFAIVSPEARVELDHTCMVGEGWWNDDWWPRAVATGLMDVANHSWDHNHHTLERPCQGMTRPGGFKSIDSREAADFEIAQAREYLHGHAPGPGVDLFAYPYGDWNPYLVDEYLPASGMLAAFTTEPGYLDAASNRWRMPRFMCGQDWRSKGDLLRILRGTRP
jgi:hypothetical protein